jgi:hypothetical protein
MSDENSVAAAAAGGDELKLLYALRDRIATEIETCPTRDLSPLTIRLLTIVEQIKEHEERQRVEGSGKKQEQAGDDNGDDGGDAGDSAAWTPDRDV